MFGGVKWIHGMGIDEKIRGEEKEREKYIRLI